MENKQLLYLNNKQLLYKKLNALRLEVDNSVVESIKETVDDLLTASTTEPNDKLIEVENWCLDNCFRSGSNVNVLSVKLLFEKIKSIKQEPL